MKSKLIRYYFLTLIVSYFMQVKGQTEKYNQLIGGTISGFYRSEYPREVSFNLQPTYGNFLCNNLAVGFKLPSTFSFSKVSSNCSYGFSPFIRKYIKTSVPLKPFCSLGIGFSHYVDKIYDASLHASYPGNLYSYDFDIGFNYFLSKSASIVTTIDYDQYDNFKSNQFFNKSNGYIRLNIGVEIFLINLKNKTIN